jgi:hypothetical protein
LGRKSYFLEEAVVGFYGRIGSFKGWYGYLNLLKTNL